VQCNVIKGGEQTMSGRMELGTENWEQRTGRPGRLWPT